MIPFDTGLRFERLEQRLLEKVRERIANGEITERGLARRIGISQPHIHNILKGVRVLSPSIADLILEALGMSVLDLVATGELWAALRVRAPTGPDLVHVGVGPGRISPQAPFPDLGETIDWVVLPADAVVGVRRPLLAWVDLDEPARAAFPIREIALIDTDETARVTIQPGAWYVVRLDGRGYVRQLRREGNRLFLLGQQSIWDEEGGSVLSLDGATLLQFVRARVVWIGADPRRPHWGNCPPASE